jgi:hypothetical protein
MTQHYAQKQGQVVALVEEVRIKQPRLGTRKLCYLLQQQVKQTPSRTRQTLFNSPGNQPINKTTPAVPKANRFPPLAKEASEPDTAYGTGKARTVVGGRYHLYSYLARA